MGSAKTRERESVCEMLRLDYRERETPERLWEMLRVRLEREGETVGNAKTRERERERLREMLRLERERDCGKC